ncbi:MAG TPA: isochorismatase family protein [Kofleriaceae bacterium]|jgi:nicotinamidase-related amidase
MASEAGPVMTGLARQRAALLVVDIQERLAPAMPPVVLEQVVKNARILIETARRLELPIVVSQQYPKGLGTTLPAIEAALPDTAHRFDKVEFSAVDCAAFAELAPKLGRDQWIVCGMETHVCVYQTVRGLVARGYQAHACADAVSSRTKTSWRVGLQLAERAGGIVTTTEASVFDLLQKAGTDDFKALSKLIK